MNFLVVGQAGAGKDTFASILPQDFKVLSFAEPIKDIATMIRNGEVDGAMQALKHYYHPYKLPDGTRDIIKDMRKIPKENKKDRELLQAIGTWGRSVDPDFWVKAIKKNIETSKINCKCDG